MLDAQRNLKCPNASTSETKTSWYATPVIGARSQSMSDSVHMRRTHCYSLSAALPFAPTMIASFSPRMRRPSGEHFE